MKRATSHTGTQAKKRRVLANLENTNENVMERKAGRPRKASKISVNSGRNKKRTQDSSLQTKYNRAHEVIKLCDGDVQTLEIALKLAKLTVDEKEVEKEDTEELVETTEGRHSKESALNFFLSNDFSKQSWINLHRDAKKRGKAIYPSYDIIQIAQEECLPGAYEIASDYEVRVSLQLLLNKTAERLIEALSEEDSLYSFRLCRLSVNIGFDSSSGHLSPHQKSADAEFDKQKSKSSQQTLMVTSMTVLALIHDSNQYVNKTPQSVRFVRPIRIAFEKEDTESIKKEFNRLDTEIKHLKHHEFIHKEESAKVGFRVFTCAFDGKCVNSITDNKATSRCPVCLNTAHDFEAHPSTFQPKYAAELGLGVLHCLIRSFEYLLHLSYRMVIKAWDIRKGWMEGKFFFVLFLLNFFVFESF